MDKLNIDKIIEIKKKKEQLLIKTYDYILGLCCKRIQEFGMAGRPECFYLVPSFITGQSFYTVSGCCKYIVDKLRGKELKEVNYFEPNIIHIRIF